MFSQYRHVIPCNPKKHVANNNLYDIRLPELTEDQKKCLFAIANSTFIALSKTYFARYTGSEGNLQMKIIDLNLMEIPDPRPATKEVSAKLKKAFEKICARNISPMLEEAFSECRSSERMKKLAENPVELPNELKQSDRRDLDLAVFELLGIANASEREKLVDELYYETANHFRQIRIVEVQKQEQRAKSDSREFRTEDFAADLWDSLLDDEKQPLAAWMASQIADGLPVNIPEGDARLPDATDFLDASTVFFRAPGADKADFKPLPLPSRPHAELVHFAWQQKIHGKVPLPKTEKAARELLTGAMARLKALTTKADKLARSRTSDERKAIDLSRLLVHWMINGRPKK
jgi:hypothetical protein